MVLIPLGEEDASIFHLAGAGLCGPYATGVAGVPSFQI